MAKLLEVWTSRLPAEPERTITTRSGTPMTFPALKDRDVLMGLLEAVDGSGCRAQVELPDGTLNIKVGSILQLEVPDFPDSPLRSRRLTRVIDPPKDK